MTTDEPARCPSGHRPTIEHHYTSGKTFVICWVCGLRADPVPLNETRAAVQKWAEAIAPIGATQTTKEQP